MSKSPAATSASGDADALQEEKLATVLAGFVDPAWYVEHNSDVAAAGIDPVLHFIRYGLGESRDPNPFFDSNWYLRRNPDVAGTGVNALLHYMACGAAELRNPHPRFDAEYYITEHPESAVNPLLFHLRVGQARGYLTERPFHIDKCLPSKLQAFALPAGVTADVVVPVYRGLAETRRCLDSVLADTAPPLGRVIVVEDRSPEPDLVAWLRTLEAEGHITLLRNRRNLGFVASANRGMEAAGDNDVVLLNSDTEVPHGWLHRLAAHAYAEPRIASVSPFSNNATICGYPDDAGGPLAFGHTLQQIDEACRTVNAGRFVELPTTVGFCMYIRREALDAVGAFDAKRFPQGYGEENDFCLRATAKGWTHRLACDVFVYHRGRVSFGDRKHKIADQALALILERFPDYQQRLARHARRGAATPYRFAITAALFRLSKLPVILVLACDEDGEIRRHTDAAMARVRDTAHVLLLEETQRGRALSMPALSDSSKITIADEQQHELEALLRSVSPSRVHIHAPPRSGLDIRSLIHRLGVPFDVTLHDYEAICPQRTLLPWPEAQYCGEPGPAICNACIADSVDRGHGARDILSWRLEHAWPSLEADRVICFSQDAKNRLDRYGLGRRAVLAPHEDAPTGDWPVTLPAIARGPLRVALLGVLSSRKGAQTVAAVAAAMPPGTLDLRLIGHTDEDFPAWAKPLISETGPYAPDTLPALIKRTSPHVIWFANSAPEPYSDTLTAAIASGLPIVAPDLGVFPERLHGRKLVWLVDHRACAADILVVFEQVRQTLLAKPAIPPTPRTPANHETTYAAPAAVRAARERPVIVALAERGADGTITAGTYIRLLQPLDHPAVARDYQLVLGEADAITQYSGQVIVTQPQAVPDQATAGAIVRHTRDNGIKLVVDLDNDFGRGDPVTDLLIGEADAVWAATEGLASMHPGAAVMESRPDERLWTPIPPAQSWADPIELVWLGSPDEAEDLASLQPTLMRLKQSYDDRIEIKVLGLPEPMKLPDGIDVIRPPPLAASAYPSFVHWLRMKASTWHLGLAPMTDAPANRFRSPIRAWEYAALGIPVLASNVPAYRGSAADGQTGKLVMNTPVDWYAAVDRMIRDPAARSELAARARAAFDAGGALGSVAEARRLALDDLLAKRRPRPNALRPTAQGLDTGHELSGTTSRTRRRSGHG